MNVPLSAPLSLSLIGAGESPIKIEVDVKLWPADEVEALRAELAELRAMLSTEREANRRLEYLYRCESLINAQLVDLLREHGVSLPARFRRKLGTIGP